MTETSLSNDTFSFIYQKLEELIRKLFDRELQAGDVDPELVKEQYLKLREGIEKGYGIDFSEDTRPEVAERIRKNVFVFSAFKNYQQLREMSDQLLDAEGNIRAFEDFKQKALAVHEKYNKRWLRSEYDHAVGSSQMASKWQDYEQMEETPILRYETAGDDRVRPSHQIIDGTTLRADHSFWDTNYPPNDWGCRCDAFEVGVAEPTREDRVKTIPDQPEMFRNNVGKDGTVFPRNHPYYEVQRGDAGKAQDNFGLQDPDEQE